MWSSGNNNSNNNNTKNHYNNKKNNCFSISSTSSSTSSSSSPSAFSNPKNMEQVWNDITLSSLSASHDGLQDPHFKLQDFLARPFSHNPPNTNLPSSAALNGSPPPPPATVLSLNSGQDVHFEPQVIMPISNVGSFSTAVPYDGSVGLLGKKRFPDSDENTGDRRHKRMIKNRESAARSRARKQAYTNELQLEVESLMKENDRLKEQQQQLWIAASTQVPQKHHTLHRTSTAPF